MDKNTRIAMVLTSLFIVVWYMGVMPRISPPPAKVTAQQVSPGGTALRSNGVGSAEASDQKQRHSEETAGISWTGASAKFSTRSAGLAELWVRTKTDEVNLVANPDNETLPLGTFPALDYSLRRSPTETIFSAKAPEGWALTKSYEVRTESQIQKLTLKFSNPTKKPLSVPAWTIGWGPGLGASSSIDPKENHRDTRVIAFRQEGKGGFLDKFKKTGTYPVAHQWVAIDNRYFLAALFPPPGEFPFIDVQRSKNEPASFVLSHPEMVLAPGESKDIAFSFYLGPKGYTHLEQVGLHLERAIDFGPFGFLGKWTLTALYFLNKILGNYGWSIMLLTLCLQILLFPLTRKSFKAAQDMKRIQPQLKVIQEKFKGDPKRLQQEMMTLYKKAGVNPFGGCLPILPQIPIFWALFTTLRNAFELQGAPWAFWIHDLSHRDPYYVLPVLMGLGMFAQQKITTVQTDPTQKQMAYIMPPLLTFMFMKFPAGVALYMVTNSSFTILSQTLMLRSQKKAVAHAS